jgi:hypothetical protein
MEISEINGYDSLEFWLRNKPAEWSQAIATRAALRIAPLGLHGVSPTNTRLSKKDLQNFILYIFRGCIITQAYRLYSKEKFNPSKSAASAVDLKRAVRSNQNSKLLLNIRRTFNESYKALHSLLNASSSLEASAFGSSQPAISSAISAITNANDTITDNETKLYFWQTIKADCSFLEADFDIENYSKAEPSDHAMMLLQRPLWMIQNDATIFIAGDLPKIINRAFKVFEISQFAEETSFGLISDWYKGILIGDSTFGVEIDILIAEMSPAEWGDYDNEIDPIEVMDRVAAIAGWGRKKPLIDSNWDFFISYNEHDEAVAKRISNILEDEGYSVFSQFNDMTVGKSFVQEMNKGLEGMGRMIAVYSPDYFSSGPCMSEWEAAYLTDTDGSKGNIVPFLVKACSPPPLARRIIWKSLQGLNSQQERTAVLAALDKADVPKTRVAMRNALKDTSSPDIVSDATDEKLDVVPNKQFDTPFVEEELLDLPEVLRSLIDTLLAGVEQTNCPPTLKQALKAYSNELDARGANCILGVLRAQMDVIELGLSSEQAEYWCSEETLIGAFEKIKEYHLQLITHYPLDQTRQRLVNAIDVAPEKLNGENFDDHRREIIKATADAHEAGEVTDRYRNVTENQLTVARDVLDVATPDFSQSDDKEFDLKERDRIARIEDAKKRRLTDVVGTADKSLEVMTKMTKLAESETAKNLLNALKRLGDWFW